MISHIIHFYIFETLTQVDFIFKPGELCVTTGQPSGTFGGHRVTDTVFHIILHMKYCLHFPYELIFLVTASPK